MRSQNIILLVVSCSKGKLSHEAPAREFYTGQAFQQLRRLAQRNRFDWRVLSSKFGLLTPNQLVKPYDQKLKDTQKDIERVRALALPKLEKLIPKYKKIIIFMGNSYRKVIEPLFNEKCLVFHDKKGIFGWNKVLFECKSFNTAQTIRKLESFNINDDYKITKKFEPEPSSYMERWIKIYE